MSWLSRIFGRSGPGGVVGWIVWERFDSYEWSPRKDVLKSAGQSPEVRAEVLAEGPSGWVVYKHKETADRIAKLLFLAAARDPRPRKVRCFQDKNDPRIRENARTMENGWVIVELEKD